MYNASSWEAQTRELISRIEHEIEDLQADTARKIAEWNRKKAALEESLVTFRQMMYMEDKSVSEVLTPEDIRDKSQKDILVLIASRNNGLLVANQAIKMMKEAGIFGNPENASSAVYSVLKRATKEFDRVGQGVYKLHDFSDTSAGLRLSLPKETDKTAFEEPEPEDEEEEAAIKEEEELLEKTESGTLEPEFSIQQRPASTANTVPTNSMSAPQQSLPPEIEKIFEREPDHEPENILETAESSWIDNIEPEAIMLMPETIARRYNAIPVSLTGNTLVVAMANPYDIYAIEAFTTQCHKHITPVAAALEEIRKAIEIYYKG